MEMRPRFWAAVAACVVGLGACGSGNHPVVSNGPVPTWAYVTGEIKRCGGQGPGKCRIVRFVSISLFDSRGRLASAEHGGTVHHKTLTSFSLVAQSPGRYSLQATIDGQTVRRAIRLRAGQRLHANLVMSIK